MTSCTGGNFNGSVDQLICEAMDELDAPIALSPGFRWGTTLLPGTAITMEDLMAQVAIMSAITLTEMVVSSSSGCWRTLPTICSTRPIPAGWGHGAIGWLAIFDRAGASRIAD